MNKLLLTGLLFLCSLNCSSTCIAIYVAENGRIYVAADSRRTFYFDNKQKFESICKIHHVGNNYFAIAGIDDGGLLKAATGALEQNANIDTALHTFEDAMVKRYTRLMTDARLYYPQKFKHFLKDGLASVSFFGYGNDEPYVLDVEFLLDQDKKGQVVVSYRVRHIAYLTVIGISEDIANARPGDLPPQEIIRQNPELYVESLVKIEARKKPLAVSEPIDLLELGPNGPNWIRKNKSSVSY